MRGEFGKLTEQKISIEELTNVVSTTWNRDFRPCEYAWLYQSCTIKKIKCPRYEDMSDDEIQSMDEHHLFQGHHFGRYSAYPVIRLLMEKEGYSLDDIWLGSSRTPFDIYAGHFERDSQVVQVEIGTVTHIGKLMESYKDKVKSVWLYNFDAFVYVFKLKSKSKNLYDFMVKNVNKEILECLHMPTRGLRECLRDFNFDNCVFVKKLNNKIPCSFEEAYFKSKMLKDLSFYARMHGNLKS